jgi:enamine deaminase RidA (YjgF/YER057c/UK114 family)
VPPNAERQTPNGERQTVNGERRAATFRIAKFNFENLPLIALRSFPNNSAIRNPQFSSMNTSSTKNSAEKRLVELGIALPDLPKPMANYVPFVRSGNLLFISGQGPRTSDHKFLTGKVGKDITVEEAYDHARLVGINLLAVVYHAQNGFDTVRRVVKLTGFVNATDDFRDPPKVINGCSDLLVDVFGEAGRHARSAIGVSSLPENISVEIEAVFEVA